MAWTRRTLLAAGACQALAACTHRSDAASAHGAQTSAVTGDIIGGVRVFDPEMADVVAPDAAVERLVDGFEWTEGPLWIGGDSADGYLLFTDVPGNVAYRWSRAASVSEFLNPSGLADADPAVFREPGANGLIRGGDGRLWMCDCGNRAIAAVDLATKEKTIIIDRYEGQRFNSPNDLVLSRAGSLYFTDPPYGLAGINDSPAKELAVNGVYRRTPDGQLELLDDTFTFPNGVALSPDERTLYVSQSDPNRPIVKAYDLDADGAPTASRVFFDASSLMGEGVPGLPDGMAVDDAGRIYATGPGGVMVLSPDGRLLGVIGAGRAVANCTFGEDGRTLFLTAHDCLARIRLRARQAPPA